MFAREMLREIPIEKIKALYGMEISKEKLRTVQYVYTFFFSFMWKIETGRTYSSQNKKDKDRI